MASRTPVEPAPSAPAMSAAQNPGTPREIARFFVGLASGRLLVLLVVLALGARLAAGRFALADGLVAAGVLAAWPFIEWLVHVFWLHLDPVELPRWRVGRFTLGGRFDPFVARKHRAHHRDPWRLDHVMIPLHTYLYSVPLNLLFWFGLFEPPQALTGLTMVCALGLHYEVVHLLAHSRYRPRSRFYRRLWRNHRLHHCKSEKHWLGVTMLLGDRVLGTSGDPRAVPTSPTCRTLGQEETLGA